MRLHDITRLVSVEIAVLRNVIEESECGMAELSSTVAYRRGQRATRGSRKEIGSVEVDASLHSIRLQVNMPHQYGRSVVEIEIGEHDYETVLRMMSEASGEIALHAMACTLADKLETLRKRLEVDRAERVAQLLPKLPIPEEPR